MSNNNLSKQEIQRQLAYAERQFEQYRLRVEQAQITARMALAQEDMKKMKEYLQRANNFLHMLADCSDFIDSQRRALDNE